MPTPSAAEMQTATSMIGKDVYVQKPKFVIYFSHN